MSRPTHSLGPEYFARIYAESDDPWSFATSPYERDKYAATLAALPKALYASGLEVGCSIGVLTELLSERCEALLAVDLAELPLTLARARNAARTNVTFAKLVLPTERPSGSFELIVLSEVVYYWNRSDIERAASLLCDLLLPGGNIILVHWIKETDYPLSGDEAVEAFLAAAGDRLRLVKASREEHYRLDLLVRRE